ncbi:MAG: orotate phosphoribosyltransferase [Clostridiales bacterium]|nr:orotate phosphoribosyltransferase [Clostridiales bacterium]
MNDAITIRSERDHRVFIHATEGHFVTASSHINYYVGTSDIKHNHNVSVDAAMLMAEYYVVRDIAVDTVLCLYETQALGAYLAHELSRPSMLSPNPPADIYVLGPEYDAVGNMIFRDNLIKMISGKRVLVLISCITSGQTVDRAIESVGYYGGSVVGISAAFSATKEINGIEVNSIFTEKDLPDYKVYDKHHCPLCKSNVPVSAIANGHGYSKLY